MSRESKQPTAVKRVVAGPERFARRESHETRTRFRSESTLSELLWTLFQGRRTLLAITALSLAFAATYVWIVTPQYASNVVVQVDPKTKVLAGLEDISAAFSEGTPADTEIQIIRSRTLLRSAAEQLQLDVQARPRRFPIIGKAIARNYKGSGPAAAPFNLGSFNWGGESIRVTKLSVPDRLLGEPLTLTVIDEGRYKVETKDGEPLLAGEVDKLATGEVDKLRVEIFIQEMRARPGAQFILQKLRLDDVVHGLGSNLKVAEPARRTGVITLSLMGSDPVLVADTLNAIATSYQRQNVAFRSADAAKTLEFLETQLPTLKQNLDKAEAALNAFRLSRGTVDLSRETQSILERTVEIEKALSDLDMQRTELRQRFTGGHPALSSADEKSASLRHQQAALQTRMRNLPVTELDSARLVRDAKVANELYFLVSNRAQELRILKSGTVGNVRIVDRAFVPTSPVSPNKPLVLALAAMLGLGLGAGMVFVRKAMDRAADDPDEIEASTGIPVYVTIPHSSKQGSVTRAARRHPGNRLPLLSSIDAGDAAVESLRVLRTSLQVALATTKNNIIAVGGPSPGVGKTFVCVNLADVLASAGQRVLLVDGDLRRGTVHRYFGLDRGPGISEALSGDMVLTAALRSTSVPNLDVLTTGTTPRNPAELLAGTRFQIFLEGLSKRYDLVVVDTPPVLAVADAALIASQAGLNLLVLKAGRHPLGEIALAVKRIEQGGGEVSGIVVNDVRYVTGRYGRDGQYQRYEYRSIERE